MQQISLASYMFYSYLIFLIARSLAYPKDVFLHLIAAAFSLLIYIIFMSKPPLLRAFFDKCENSLLKNGTKIVFILLVIFLLSGLIYCAIPFKSFFVDEAKNLHAASYILHNGLGSFFKNYATLPWLGQQHPFLIPLINSIAFKIFGVHLYIARLITLIFSGFTLFFVYLLGRELYNVEMGLFSMLFLMLFQIYFRTSCAALIDIQLTFFFVMSLYLFLRYSKTHNLAYAFFCGITIGFGTLTKYSMFLIYLVLLIYLLLTKKFLKEIKNIGLWVILLMSLLILMPWLIYMHQSNVSAQQYNRIYACSRTVWNYKGFVILRFFLDCLPSGIGAQNIPFLIIGLFKILKDRGRPSIFILCWVISFFMVVPLLADLRYTLPAYPAIAILMAYGLTKTGGHRERIKLILLSASFLFISLIMYLFVSPGVTSKFRISRWL